MTNKSGNLKKKSSIVQKQKSKLDKLTSTARDWIGDLSKRTKESIGATKDKDVTYVVRSFLKRQQLKFVVAVMLLLLGGVVYWGLSSYVQVGVPAQPVIRQPILPLEQLQDPFFPTVIDTTKSVRDSRLVLLYKIYKLNHPSDLHYQLAESLSRNIDLDRPPSDLRPPQCQEIPYRLSQLPTISVVIPMYNEAVSMVLRTLHSIINNTPPQILQDIILIDDNSKHENLKSLFTDYLYLLPKVKIIRNKKREGLIRSRMIGVHAAEGQVFVFQDAHTEVGPKWAEPALQYLIEHPKSIVQPKIQTIDPVDISWPNRSETDFGEKWRGVVGWNLRFFWNVIKESYPSHVPLEDHEPFLNPVLIGSSMIISRDYFLQLGGFDEGFNIWGGENLELSFRAWMCGGSIVVHPCSQVAHLFKGFTYEFDGNREEIIAMNMLRVVELWLDDYSKYYYAAANSFNYKDIKLTEEMIGSIQKRKKFRKDNDCENFDWYLKNIIPEMTVPDRHAVKLFGEIQNRHSDYCWQVAPDGYITLTADCYVFSRVKYESEFTLTKTGLLMYQDKCVQVTDNYLLRTIQCNNTDEWSQGWGLAVSDSEEPIEENVGRINFLYPQSQDTMCLQHVTNVLKVHHKEQMPQLAECDPENTWQVWSFTYSFDFGNVPRNPLQEPRLSLRGPPVTNK